MRTHTDVRVSQTGCGECRKAEPLGFDFTMAFQPIVDLHAHTLFAYEALVRGSRGEGAAWVLGQVNDQNRYSFDQTCRTRAIALAAGLGLHRLPGCYLSINFLPNAVYRPDTCIQSTLAACVQHDFPPDRLMFEVSEGEHVTENSHLIGIFNDYRARDFLTAIDDFGAGYAGLNLLALFQPRVLKLDMGLIRDIDTSVVRQAIVEGVVQMANSLGIILVAEGVETSAERDTLYLMGIYRQQGYLFARPQIEALPLCDEMIAH